jgi:hypothetical protein
MAGKDKVLFVRCGEELQSALKAEWERVRIKPNEDTSFAEFLRRILHNYIHSSKREDRSDSASQ